MSSASLWAIRRASSRSRRSCSRTTCCWDSSSRCRASCFSTSACQAQKAISTSSLHLFTGSILPKIAPNKFFTKDYILFNQKFLQSPFSSRFRLVLPLFLECKRRQRNHSSTILSPGVSQILQENPMYHQLDGRCQGFKGWLRSG